MAGAGARRGNASATRYCGCFGARAWSWFRVCWAGTVQRLGVTLPWADRQPDFCQHAAFYVRGPGLLCARDASICAGNGNQEGRDPGTRHAGQSGPAQPCRRSMFPQSCCESDPPSFRPGNNDFEQGLFAALPVKLKERQTSSQSMPPSRKRRNVGDGLDMDQGHRSAPLVTEATEPDDPSHSRAHASACWSMWLTTNVYN